MNSHTMFNNLFEFTDESHDIPEDQDEPELDESKLEDLDENNGVT